MKLSFAVAVFIGAVSAAEPVWSLRSVNDHEGNIDVQKSYAEYSTGKADKLERPSENSNVQLESDSDSDSSDSDEENVQIGDWYTVYDSGQAFNGKYERVVTDRFSADTDDVFMRSVIANFAVEKKNCDADGKNCVPSGSFWLNKSGAKALAQEVLQTHKNLSGDKLASYMATYFDKAWGHFDVNRVGVIEVAKAPNMMRFLASDQRMQLGESGF